MAVLVCTDLHKRFGNRTAVDGVGFEIAGGECYGLLGPNGAGKTTTISMICGLLASDGGSVVVAGRPVGPRAIAAKADVGYVPQEVALYPDLSARENLAFFGRLYGLTGKELDARIDASLETVGLLDRGGERIEQYSGGMKRRANIAAGLLHQPKLLVLDEPTVGVDPQSRNAIFDTVVDLRDAGLAVLYTTHYMEEAERLCDRIGIIDQGRLVAEGTRRELVAQVSGLDHVRITVEGDRQTLAARCLTIPGVDEAVVADGFVELRAHDGRQLLRQVVEAADAAGVEVSSIELVELDLEAVFLQLTGRALRD
ncbi:MAG: linearmycin/streptolysin transport system ATP-binding protein [Actinomycetota bacterium]|nr:linearmycin/streptolysin transport system ATP-binding protein [Actinomycetota bacterium]